MKEIKEMFESIARGLGIGILILMFILAAWNVAIFFADARKAITKINETYLAISGERWKLK